MNQTELCNQLARSAEDRLLMRRVLDQAVAAERKCIPCRTHFLSPREVALARQLGCVVLLSGVEDLVTDGGGVLHITGGCDRMRMVTGAGCMLSVLCGAFAAVQPQTPLQAAADAARFWKLCAARAGQNAVGPGSLRAALLDSAAALTDAEFSPSVRFSEA